MNGYPPFYPNMGTMPINQPMQQASTYNQQPTMAPQSSYNQQMYSQPVQQPTTTFLQSLPGRPVENKEVLSLIDLPIGSNGVFPKTDLSEIYIKVWNKAGTTDVITYRPVDLPVSQQTNIAAIPDGFSQSIDQLLQKITALEEKIDSLSLNNKSKNAEPATVTVTPITPATNDAAILGGF